MATLTSTVGNVNASYDYYPSGLRLKNNDTYMLYDGGNIIAEYDVVNDEYIAVYGYAINRINRITEVEQAQVYIYNAHGDVIGMVSMPGENNTPSVIEKEYDYDAFGNEVFPDPDDENPFRYCGEYYDKGTNRLYLRARDYDASTGRFTSEDPIGYGLNWYTYCHNNPISFIDPSGMVDVMLMYAINEAGGSCIVSNDEESVIISINGRTYFQKIGTSRGEARIWKIDVPKEQAVQGYGTGIYLMMDSIDLQHMFGIDAKSIEHTMDDEYYSIDSAAIAWTIINNPISIKENREYASVICKTKNGYTLSEVMIGTSDEISPTQNVYLLSQNPTAVAHIHSHAACPHERDSGGEIFSGSLFTGRIGDTDFADEKVVPIYLATPGGNLKCYIPPDPNDKYSRYSRYDLGMEFYRDPKCNHY